MCRRGREGGREARRKASILNIPDRAEATEWEMSVNPPWLHTDPPPPLPRTGSWSLTRPVLSPPCHLLLITSGQNGKHSRQQVRWGKGVWGVLICSCLIHDFSLGIPNGSVIGSTSVSDKRMGLFQSGKRQIPKTISKCGFFSPLRIPTDQPIVNILSGVPASWV